MKGIDECVYKVVSSSCDDPLIECYFLANELHKAFTCFDNFVFENSFAKLFVKRSNKWILEYEVD